MTEKKSDLTVIDCSDERCQPPRVRLVSHGRSSLEWVFDWPVSPGTGQARYRGDLYFFVPAALRLTPERYSVESFFHDLDMTFQFVPSAMTFRQLLERDNCRSPIYRLRQFSMQGRPDLSAQKAAAYELRSLVNVVVTQLDRRQQRLERELGQRGEVAGESFQQFVLDASELLQTLRQEGSIWHSENMTESVRMSYTWADEVLSLACERTANKLHTVLRQQAAAQTKAIDALRNFIMDEVTYRQKNGFDSIYNPLVQDSGPKLLRRRNALWNWAQSALHVSLQTSTLPDKLRSIFAGIAAALAMTFTVFVMMGVQKVYDINSAVWVIVAVGSYILKDRIKEETRKAMSAWLPRLIADDARRLLDPYTKKQVGRSRARMRREKWSKIPQELMAGQALDPLYAQGKIGQILHYQCDIVLDLTELNRAHTRLDRILQRCRLQIDPWHSVIDETRRSLYYFDADGTEHCERVLSTYGVEATATITRLNDKGYTPPPSQSQRLKSRRGRRRPKEPSIIATFGDNDEVIKENRIEQISFPTGKSAMLWRWHFAVNRRGLYRRRRKKNNANKLPL